MRHIPPFPFKGVAKIDPSTFTLAVLNGSNRSLDIWSSNTFSQLLRIEKKGDFGTSCFDKLGQFIAYSDCKDTQIFNFDQSALKL